MIAGRILRMNRAFEGEGRIADEDGARTRTASIDPLPSFALVLVRELTTKVALTFGQDRDADHAGPAKLRPGGRLALDGKCDERRVQGDPNAEKPGDDPRSEQTRVGKGWGGSGSSR